MQSFHGTRDQMAAYLRRTFALDTPEASLMAEFAEATGTHYIAGSNGKTLVYSGNGNWKITP